MRTKADARAKCGVHAHVRKTRERESGVPWKQPSVGWRSGSRSKWLRTLATSERLHEETPERRMGATLARGHAHLGHWKPQ